jgi:hypothetical protein
VAPRLEGIYEQHGARLWRAVYLYSGDREVASDAVAEAFRQAPPSEGGAKMKRSLVWITVLVESVAASSVVRAGILRRRRALMHRSPGDRVSVRFG